MPVPEVGSEIASEDSGRWYAKHDNFKPMTSEERPAFIKKVLCLLSIILGVCYNDLSADTNNYYVYNFICFIGLQIILVRLHICVLYSFSSRNNNRDNDILCTKSSMESTI